MSKIGIFLDGHLMAEYKDLGDIQTYNEALKDCRMCTEETGLFHELKRIKAPLTEIQIEDRTDYWLCALAQMREEGIISPQVYGASRRKAKAWWYDRNTELREGADTE